MTSAKRGAAYFDQWYADMAASPVRDAIIARALRLPPGLHLTGVLPGPAVTTLTEELGLSEGGLLLDIACGRGGYGIEVAHRTGSRLIGVDFSAEALRQATSLSTRRLPTGRAEFRLGTLVATGLPAAAADGLMCVDAVQFAEPPPAALIEFRRLLRSGGRLALTCWEAADPADRRVPARIQAVDLRRDLPRAGFVDVRVREQRDWREAERTLWQEAVAADGTDPAVRSLQEEGRRSLDTFDSLRRVLATATAP
ncbi:class I SAM-dependent methyltransferase [Actinoplanes sp. NPDC048967]|uniref:class I SAM-dependent methyltransferase n=1 Tax=Actinoplanes sp. NPDC048967 TaxID=3155269 RepID=UPI0033E7F23C